MSHEMNWDILRNRHYFLDDFFVPKIFSPLKMRQRSDNQHTASTIAVRYFLRIIQELSSRAGEKDFQSF
jgi:hypothetical protein